MNFSMNSKLQIKKQLATKPIAPIVASYRVARKAGNSSEFFAGVDSLVRSKASRNKKTLLVAEQEALRNTVFQIILRCQYTNTISATQIKNGEIKTISESIAI